MEKHIVKIKSLEKVTHDVWKVVTEKPAGYEFTPGQATEISINQRNWEDERRPFTFTSLPGNDYLEFTIKSYPEHKAVTNELMQLKANDELILHDVFGAIAFKGPGVFIAGGAGVTPFISIFRFLKSTKALAGNKLIFANKTKADIILKEEFETLLGDDFINVLSEEKAEGNEYGRINEALLKKHVTDHAAKIYICGPEPMMDAVESQLAAIGISAGSIVKEEF